MKKAEAKAKTQNADREKWDYWFMGKDIHDIKAYLRETKFPAKLK